MSVIEPTIEAEMRLLSRDRSWDNRNEYDSRVRNNVLIKHAFVGFEYRPGMISFAAQDLGEFPKIIRNLCNWPVYSFSPPDQESAPTIQRKRK